jgi:hypothetical protein
MSTQARIAAAIAAAAVIVVTFVIANNSSDSGGSSKTVTVVQTSPTGGATVNKTTTPIATVTVKDAKPVGGIKKLSFTKGDTVAFRVVSDTADEIHVHGYNFMKDVSPGHPVTFSFPGTIEGRFVVELEGHKQQIIDLEVNP